MQDRELYRQILGITNPWFVDRVDLQMGSGEVHVYLEHGETEWACSECGQKCRLYDHQPERRWRHLDTCQYRTILHAKVPRSDCPAHGTRVVKLPWAEPHSRFTALMEGVVLHWLKHASLKAVSQQLNLSWDETQGIMQRAVERGLARRKLETLTYLGIDEKAYRKGHRYLTLVNDLETGRVLYVAEDREQRSLDGFWSLLTQQQLHGIQAVAIDMWDAYLNSLREHLPQADQKIVYDKFHIAQHLGEAIDDVRRQEHKQLQTGGDQTLKGTRWSWLTNPVNMTWHEKRNFSALKHSHLKTARAWALKQSFMELFRYSYEGPARKHFTWWHAWAVRSRLQPMIKVAGMVKRRFENIITYLRHPITNATSESINAKIQWVKYTARGYRNKQNFINAIYFHAGGLDLDPLPTK